MGMLKQHAPAGGELELDEQARIEDALSQLNLATQAIQAFSVNGSIVRDKSHPLSEGDELIVLPPVGGG